ncbi:MAG: peptidase M16 [Waddliaceae bacterium]|nr:peptidase M16 [Waddliaceae bacterium]
MRLYIITYRGLFMCRTTFYLFKFIAFSLCTICLYGDDPEGTKDVEITQASIVDDESGLKILTPSMAEVQTRKLRLSNALEVYLISDPQVEKSAAALSVGVGSWHNPKEVPGLAHFLEHMLFLGTEKYPVESEYDRFIRENGGMSNAYTSHIHTNYMFQIQHPAFEEALDRFSEFFKHPLFNESGVSRELLAVDQEFSRKYENDDTRNHYISKALSESEHPFSRFSVGNKDTLSQLDQEKLKSFFLENYSSNLMKLVLLSPLSIDELQQLATDKFSHIQNNEKSQFHTDSKILSLEGKGKLTYVVPIKDMKRLQLSWELPQRFAHMPESDPGKILAHILGHEGSNSLLAQLKRENLAEVLYAGGSRVGFDNYLFSIQIDLTEKGLAQLEHVIKRCFQAIVPLKQQLVPEYIFEEIQTMAKAGYAYQSRSEPFHVVSMHAGQLQEEELSTYPLITLIPQSFSPEEVQKFAQELLAKNCQFILTAPYTLTGIQPDMKEEWYNISYSTEVIPEDKLTAWENTQELAEIGIPAPNPFVPKSLELLYSGEVETGIPTPELLIDHDFGQLYFVQDHLFQIPQVDMRFRIKAAYLDSGDAEKMVLADLHVRSINEALNTLSYPANLAGLHYEVTADSKGFTIHIVGYSDKALTFFNQVLEKIQNCAPSESQFTTYHDSLKQQYSNYDKENPLKQSLDLLRSVLFAKYVTKKEKAEALDKLSLQDLLLFQRYVFNKAYIEGIVFGNISDENARRAFENLSAAINHDPYPKSEHKDREVIVLPECHGPYYIVKNVERKGNAVLLMLQNGPASYTMRGALDILRKAIQQPFFSELRTKQQTAYEVWNVSQEIEKQLYSFFGILSNSHDIRDLLARFELFFETFLHELGTDQFSEERFEAIRASILNELKQTPTNPSEMVSLLQELAFEHEANFKRIEERIQAIENLTFSQFIEDSRAFLGRDNTQRLAILVKGRIEEEANFRYQEAKDIEQLRQISDYVGKSEPAGMQETIKR